MWKTALSCTTSLALLCALLWLSAGPALPGSPASSPQTTLVALLPAADDAVTAALVRGLDVAFEELAQQEGRSFRLEVGRASTQWSNAAPEAVRLVFKEGARVLITPPDRRVAHLLAQIGTRAHVPVVTTSPAATVRATGSTWVRGVVECGKAQPPGQDDSVCTALEAGLLSAGQRERATRRFLSRYGRAPGSVEWAGFGAGLEAARLIAP